MKVIRRDLKTDKKLKIPTELRTTTSHFDYSNDVEYVLDSLKETISPAF